MCQKIVQFYQFVLIITSIVIVYMQLYQCFYSHKNEYDLLHTIGMSYKKIRRMYIVKLLAFIIILDVIVLLILRTIQIEVLVLYLIGSLILCTLFTKMIFNRIYKQCIKKDLVNVKKPLFKGFSDHMSNSMCYTVCSIFKQLK